MQNNSWGHTPSSEPSGRRFGFSWKAGMAFGWVVFLGLLCLFVFWQKVFNEQASVTLVPGDASESIDIPLQDLSTTDQLALGSDRMLDVNGQLRINSSIIITPTDPPADPVAGQIYYDDSLNVPMYYDGERFVEVGKQDDIRRLQSAPSGERVIVERVIRSTTVVVKDSENGEAAIPTANTNGNIVKFGPNNTITNSLLTESGSVVSVAGALSLASGDLRFGSDAFSASLNTVPLSGDRTIALPNASGTICLQNSSSCGFMTGSPAQYIQNQNTAAQAATNFWLSGSGRADGGIITPSIDTVANGTLSIGENADTVEVDADTTVNGNLGVTANSSAVNIPLLQLEQNGNGDTTIELKNALGSSFYVGMDQSAGGVFRIGSSAAAQGTTAVGSLSAGGAHFQGVDSQIIARKITTGPSDSGTLSSIMVHLGMVDGALNGIKAALYSHDAANDRPGTLLGSTSTATAATAGWNAIPLPASITGSTTYWVAVNIEGSGTGLSFDYCGGCAGDSTTTYPRAFSAAWPTPHGAATNALNDYEWSIYMNVTAGGVNDTYAGAKLFSMTDTGAVILQNSINTSTAFQVQDAAGQSLLNLNTSTGELSVQDLTVAANKSLTLHGGSTATRPATATEGMVYYDTSTGSLLTYAKGKWQSDRSDAVLVAASDSTQSEKDAADFVADGNTATSADGDQVQINTALTAAAGKKVILLAGTYILDDYISIPNNTTLAGVGTGSLLSFPDGLNGSLSMIFNQDSANGSGVTIQDIRLDGNASNQTSGNMSGISLYGLGSGSGVTARSSAKIVNVTIANMRTNGIHIEDSSKVMITGVTTRDNGGSGISLLRVNDSTISNNVTSSSSYSGINLNDSSSNTITGNIAKLNAGNGILLTAGSDSNSITANTTSLNDNSGIQLQGSSRSSVSGNSVFSNIFAGITVQQGANSNIISSNKISDNGTTTENNGIFVWSAASNQLTNNSISDDSATNNNHAIHFYDTSVDSTYLSGNTLGGGAVNDLGTNTVFGGQVDEVGNFNIQPGGTIELLQNTNIEGTLEVSGTTTINGNLYVADMDTSIPGVLSLGGANATTVNVADNDIGHAVNIATGVGSQMVAIGSTYYSSGLLLQAGSSNMSLHSGNSMFLRIDETLNIGGLTSGANYLSVNANTGEIISHYGSSFRFDGGLRVENAPAVFNAGITITNGAALPSYTTPLGTQLQSAINIPNFTLGAYGTLLAFGLDDTNPSTARALLVADARTGDHQPTIGVLSPNESDIFGLSWDGSDGVARLKTLGAGVGIRLNTNDVAQFENGQTYFNQNTRITGNLELNGNSVFTPTTDSTDAFRIQGADTSAVLLRADTLANKLIVRTLDVDYNLTVGGDVAFAGHLRSNGAVPTTITGPAACTSPSVTVSGTDTSGMVRVIAGTGCTAPGAIMAVQFASVYGTAPKVTLTPATAAAANLPAYIDYAQVTTSTFDIATASPLADGADYRWYYHVIE